ncbi:hypothetical protein EST38_g14495 [Candolleomyces aberdarensis]|uniref:Uncharacterized protein n=1 Tax=Candolleomyces aberdarensis TaxID=2316362 RepID=A0A4Q2CX45_9AGAR|nr:hypothetical protein EST38_g14495 [Candolleomyces aberdarensis]
MTVANRSEMLDACMADINWRKLQTMVAWLSRQHKRAREELRTAEKNFDDLDKTASKVQRDTWQRQMSEANENRLTKSDPSAMDLYNAKNSKEDVELSIIPLPSSFDVLPDGWMDLAQTEEELRVAQANEALELLRSDIGHKSYLYRANRALANGKRERTRGYDSINAVERSMRINAQKYRLALWALERLSVATKYPQFQALVREDTKAVTAIYDPNKPGLRTDIMSWIWKINIKEDSETHNYLDDIYRVNWIRSISVRDRWQEELVIVESEMECPALPRLPLVVFVFLYIEMLADALVELKSLDHAALLNLLQYATSRSRSIGLTYVTNHGRCSDKEKDHYLSYLSNELLTAAYILGYGVSVYTDRIPVPPSLRRMMRAVTQNQLANTAMLLQIVTSSDAKEHLLAHYSGDWWTGYPATWTDDSPRPVTSVTALVEHWRIQRRNAISLDRRNIVDAANLAGLSVAELQEAQSVAEDTVATLDLEWDLTSRQISLVNYRIAELTDLEKRLKALTEKKSLEHLKDDVAEGSTGGAKKQAGGGK